MVNLDHITAAEWTHHISYSPSLISVNIRGHDATAKNIEASKEFGVNIAAEDHNVICSIAGRYSGRNVDKSQFLRDQVLLLFMMPSRSNHQCYKELL